MNKGKFIVIEGANGVGKTTLIENMRPHLTVPFHAIAEPSTGPIGRRLRDILAIHGKIPPVWAEPLFLLDRISLIQSIINPMINEGMNVICDRWALSTLSYHSGKAFGNKKVHDYAVRESVLDVVPNMTIILESSVAALQQRRPHMKIADIEKIVAAYAKPYAGKWAVGNIVYRYTSEGNHEVLSAMIANVINEFCQE